MQSEKQLIKTFTGKSCLQDSPTAQWAEITAKYPAFTLGHYFRAKKQLKAPETNIAAVNNDQKRLIQQAAAKHFNDIRWLDYLLKSDFTQAQPSESLIQSPADVQASSDHNASPKMEAAASNRSQIQEEVPTKIKDSTRQSIVDSTAVASPLLPAAENSRLTAVLSAQLADFKKPLAQDARLEVQREPLYKVDYFASQGISILKNQDVLDKKVRKFTDWLKEMKQQTPDNSGVPKLNTTPQEEAQAAKKAEASLKIEPIWTESMAEVLISQGKSAQARAVYQKLSLLYPEKSAYFASKIDLLQ